MIRTPSHWHYTDTFFNNNDGIEYVNPKNLDKLWDKECNELEKKYGDAKILHDSLVVAETKVAAIEEVNRVLAYDLTWARKERADFGKSMLKFGYYIGWRLKIWELSLEFGFLRWAILRIRQFLKLT